MLFFNTFGKDFGNQFDSQRLNYLNEIHDHPIDMKFLKKLSDDDLLSIQVKCPQARFMFEDRMMMEITLKLVLLNLKNQNQPQSVSSMNEKRDSLKMLKFIVESFLNLEHFGEIEGECE